VGDCAAGAEAGAFDTPGCITTNKMGLEGTYMELYRSDVVAAMTSCVAASDCATILGSPQAAIDPCRAAAANSVSPSGAVALFCEKAQQSPCMGDYTATCITDTKSFSDTMVGKLTDCLTKSCADHESCVRTAAMP
jgi:hypothetical protein